MRKKSIVTAPNTNTTELFVASSGLFGQVITVVDAPSGTHVKTLKLLRLNLKSKTLFTQ